LAHEGFVELLPYRGARVSVIRLKNVQEHYQLKAMLDGYGCYAAAQKLTEEDFATLANNICNAACNLQNLRNLLCPHFITPYHLSFLLKYERQRPLCISWQYPQQSNRVHIDPKDDAPASLPLPIFLLRCDL
jgi:hypothetical protein